MVAGTSWRFCDRLALAVQSKEQNASSGKVSVTVHASDYDDGLAHHREEHSLYR